MKKDEERDVPDPRESIEEIPTVNFPLVYGPQNGFCLSCVCVWRGGVTWKLLTISKRVGRIDAVR